MTSTDRDAWQEHRSIMDGLSAQLQRLEKKKYDITNEFGEEIAAIDAKRAQLQQEFEVKIFHYTISD